MDDYVKKFITILIFQNTVISLSLTFRYNCFPIHTTCTVLYDTSRDPPALSLLN